jgi:lipopolysaccharide export system protein LptA
MINKVDRAESQTLDYDALAERIVLGGDVVMTQAPDRRATAQTVVLEQKDDKALLTGTVEVTQGRNILRGERLAIDRKAGTAKLTSPAEDDRPVGRISTLLYQNQTGKPATAKVKARPDDGEGEAETLGPLGANFKSDPNAPIEVESVTLDVNDRKHIAIYTGDVVAKQGTFVVKTAEMTAYYQGNTGLIGATDAEATRPAQAGKAGGGPGGSQLKRIEARHGVVVTGTDGQQATGEWANFDVAANTIVMGGDVTVSQGKQLVRAPAGMRLVIDLGSGVTRFEPDPDGTTSKAGPKVSGAFATSVAPSPSGAGSPTCPRGAICKTGRLEAIFYPNQIKEKAGKAAAGIVSGESGAKGPKTGSGWRPTTRPSGAP